jgi:hypothetical protein
MKQYIGISRDRSVSMRGVAEVARQDFNNLVNSFKENSIRYGIETKVSVIDCGIKINYGDTKNHFSDKFVDSSQLNRMDSYAVSGNNTPLYDSVAALIAHFNELPYSVHTDPDVSFLVMVVTDGEDNASAVTAKELAKKIKELETSDKWTIVMRVPNGYKQRLIRDGFNAGNILEFDASDEVEYAKSSVATTQAVSKFYSGRTQGLRSVSTFYVDTANITPTQVKQELANISKKVKVIRVAQEWDGRQIRDFVQEKDGHYILGTAFYQLTKREEMSDNKRIIVWDKETGYYYTGYEARTMLGLPTSGTIKIAPASFPKFEVFIQSSSVNRKLVGGTKVVVYKD